MTHGSWFYFVSKLQERSEHLSYWENRFIQRCARKIARGKFGPLSMRVMRKLGRLSHRENISSLDMYDSRGTDEHYQMVSLSNSKLFRAWRG